MVPSGRCSVLKAKNSLPSQGVLEQRPSSAWAWSVEQAISYVQYSCGPPPARRGPGPVPQAEAACPETTAVSSDPARSTSTPPAGHPLGGEEASEAAASGVAAVAECGSTMAGPRPSRTVTRQRDRKSTRLNSSHEWSSYAVFCLK